MRQQQFQCHIKRQKQEKLLTVAKASFTRNKDGAGLRLDKTSEAGKEPLPYVQKLKERKHKRPPEEEKHQEQEEEEDNPEEEEEGDGDLTEEVEKQFDQLMNTFNEARRTGDPLRYDREVNQGICDFKKARGRCRELRNIDRYSVEKMEKKVKKETRIFSTSALQ